MNDLDTQLRSYYGHIDGTQEPVEVGDVLALGERVPAIPPMATAVVLTSEEAVEPLHQKQRRGHNVLVVASAGAVVLLLGAIGLLVRSDSSAPAGQPIVDMPQQVVHQSVTESLLGDIQWTVVEGDTDSVPPNFVSSSAGFASVTEDGRFLISSDGADWTPVEPNVPGTLRSIREYAGVYFLETVADDGVAQTWESSDLVEWTQTAWFLEGEVPVLTGTGVQTHQSTRDVGVAAGSTLSQWGSSFDVDWRAIAALVVSDEVKSELDEFRFRPVLSADGTVELVRFRDAWMVSYEDRMAGDDWKLIETVAEFNLISTAANSVVEFSDSASNEVVGSITISLPDLTPEEVVNILDLGYDIGGLALSSGEGIELLEYPWTDQDNRVHFVADDEGFVAARRVGDGDTPFRMEIWRSSDGRSWKDIGLAASSSSGDENSFAERDGVMVVSFGWTDDVSEYGILRSEDGINWAPPSVPPIPTGENLVDGGGNTLSNASGHVFALSSGWVWLSSGDTDFALWTSLDGDVWEQVDTDDIPEPYWAQLKGQFTDGGGTIGAAGEAVYIYEERGIDRRPTPTRLWVIEIGS